MLDRATDLGRSPCPPEHALADLARGDAGPDALALRDHLDECDDCRIVVARLVPTIAREPEVVAGRYRVGRLLGRGGMGEVYEAWDTNLERRVALKTLGPRAGGGDDRSLARRSVARLVRESKAMARVRHPNVVAVHDAGVWQSRAFVVMELVDGETLRSWTVREPRAWTDVLARYVAAGRGLHAAHVQGIIHRDFKPDNVLVDEHGRVQVTDFGLAQWADDGAPEASPPSSTWSPAGLDDSGSLTESGAAVGTPAYMAPEQFRGEPLDPRADVFGFAVALHEALAGVRPFRGDSVRELVLAQRRGATDDALRARGIPRWLVAAILDGLHYDRRARPADMTAMLRRLEQPATRGRVAIAATIGVLAIGGAFAFAASRPSSPCAGTPLAAAWDERTLGAFATADPATQRFASGRLAPWADAWSDAWADACAAGDDAAAQLRRACLQGQLGTFAAIVRGLRDAEFDVVAAARALPRAVACDGGPALAQRMPEPDDPELAAKVTAVRVELAELEGRGVMERPEVLADACAAALERARALGFRPLESEAMIVLATNLATAGKPIEARAMFVAAAQVASASGHDSAAARAWCQLVELEADHLSEFDRGMEYADNALAAIERLGPSSEADARMLDLHFARGLLLYRQGKQDAALAEFEAAEVLARRINPDELPSVLEGKAIVLEDRGELVGAIAIHEEIAARRREQGGDFHPQLFISYANLASAHALLGHTELALDAARRSTEIALRSRGDRHPDYAMALHNEGEVLRSVGRFTEGLERLERARQVFEEILGPDNPRVASSLEHEAGALQGLGRYDEAIALMRRALEIFRRTGLAQEIAGARMNLADVLREAGRPAEGLADATAAVDTFVAELPHSAEAAYALTVQGELLVDLDRPREAMAVLGQALVIYEAGGFLPLEKGIASFAIARALVASHGDHDRALALALEAQTVWRDAPAPWDRRRRQIEDWRAVAVDGMKRP